MIEMAIQGWRNLRGVAAWLFTEPLLPGATLFTLLVWLSWRFLREGFGDVHQYAFAQIAGKASLTASVQRGWWSCTCATLSMCRCLAAVVRRLRNCCAKSIQLASLQFPR